MSPGHDAYYNKYINVKRGGIGGVAMLVTGYIVLSYVWEYEHLSKDSEHHYLHFNTNPSGNVKPEVRFPDC